MLRSSLNSPLSRAQCRNRRYPWRPLAIPVPNIETVAVKPSSIVPKFEQMVTATAPPLVGDIDEWSYSVFLNKVQSGNVLNVITNRAKNSVIAEDVDGAIHTVVLPEEFQLQVLLDKNIDVYVRPNESVTGAGVNTDSGNGKIQRMADAAMTMFNILFQVIIIGVILNAFISSRSSSSSQLFNLMGDSFKEAGEGDVPESTVKFEDVAGMEGPKRELVEIVEFLKNPEKYANVGAELPKGVLLYGPPGTGKTLLAKAVAGEAGVPFLFCSGSEFVQVFVGVGASRVRDLFKKAREKSPCIVFIDEIDAIGRARSMNSVGNANTEQEQTMNQILTEMDGFRTNDKGQIIVIAATNRKDVLDEALIRSGRFDRHVEIPLPSKNERRDILRVHTRSSTLDPEVSLESFSRLTQGMAGADLKNLVNEAKLFAARKNQTVLTNEGFHQGLDKLLLGLENNAIVMTDEQAKLVAYHEAGHALLGVLVNEYDLINRVTIVPRGDAGGLTVFQEKEQDIQLYSQQYLLNRMIVALGGRVAEQCVFGNLQVTTGASSDLDSVQTIARRMVATFGFNETLGHVSWSEDYPISGAISEAIDSEIKYLVEWAHTEATAYIQKHEFYLHRIAEALMAKKTLYYADIMKTIEGLTCEIERLSEDAVYE